MSGVQALVRLPMLQRQRDAALGLNTGGFISGYRGSPLGTYDQALWAAKKHLAQNHIVFQPGVNEELAATAVWGTQQLELYPQARSTTACSASGTARARAWTAAATSSSTPTWPAPAAMAA
jgi:indolepyruvate ferredoxin oxidoreductase